MVKLVNTSRDTPVKVEIRTCDDKSVLSSAIVEKVQEYDLPCQDCTVILSITKHGNGQHVWKGFVPTMFENDSNGIVIDPHNNKVTVNNEVLPSHLSDDGQGGGNLKWLLLIAAIVLVVLYMRRRK